MDNVLNSPVQLSKGINLKDLMSSNSEFHLDLDFKSTKNLDLLDCKTEDEDDDSDSYDVFNHIAEKTEQMMLSSPKYLTFEDLASKMADCNCIPAGCVKIHIMEEGDGPLVPSDAEVLIHYAAYWEKEEVPFDSTLTMAGGAPWRIRLGTGTCLPGIEVALTHVRGPTARLCALLQPEAAWGARGAPPRIQPKPALFVIQLSEVIPMRDAAVFNNLPLNEQTKFETTIRTVQSIRNTAKNQFTKKRYKQAIKQYQQAISVISLSRPETEEQEKEIQDLKVKIFVNLAVCYYKLNKPKYVLIYCDNIDRLIDIEKHCKALFYKGRAYESLGKIEEAVIYYKKALKLEPKNNEIGTVLAELDSKMKKSAKEETDMWRKAFKTSRQETVTFDVDDDFQDGVRDMCQDLAGRNEYSKFDLPQGLTNDEVLCIKSLASQFDGLVVEERGEGKKKKVTIIKKLLP